MHPRITIDEGTTHGAGGVCLWWRSYSPPGARARVCLAHGAADHSGRHLDTIEYLTELGFAVDTFDFRGHGRSGGVRGHVARFSEYVSDLRLFVERSVARASNGKVFVFAHSHGGLVAAHLGFLQLDDIAGVIFSAPYFASAEWPRWTLALSATVGHVLPRLGLAHGIDPDRLMRDPERRQETRDDPLFVRVVTPAWLRATRRACDEVLCRAAEFRHPSLFLVPEADGVADPAATRQFCQTIETPDKTYVSFPDAAHELVNELRTSREAFLGRFGEWLERRASRRIAATVSTPTKASP